MELRKYIWTLILLATAATLSWAQEDGGQTADSHVSEPSVSVSNEEEQARTPDILPGLNQGQTELSSGRQSFFLTALHIGQSVENNSGGYVGNSSQVSSLTTVLGSVHLLLLRRRYETAIDYLAGSEFSPNTSILGSTTVQVQQLNVEQRILWRKAELTFVDEFGDLPTGNFGSAWFGGAGLYNLDVVGISANAPLPSNLSSFFGSLNLAGFGSQITNLSMAEYTEALTKRSSMTVVGGYGVTSYSRRNGLIDSHATGAQVGYSYQVTSRDNIGFSYGFQTLGFPERDQGNLHTNSFGLTYGRRVSTRLSFMLRAGPQSVNQSSSLNGSSKQVNMGGGVSVSYLLRQGKITVGCEQLVTNGSGLFAGANTSICQSSVKRTWRRWSSSFNIGYARLTQIVQTTAYTDHYTFAGGAIDRELGRNVHAFASYQFNDINDYSVCALSSPCYPIERLHTFSVGIDLRTRRRRLE